MISRFFSARVFSLAFGLCYAVVLHTGSPLFFYYPRVGRFAFHKIDDPSLGSAMSWYGWIAAAAVFATILCAVVPKRIGDRISFAVFPITVLIMLVVAVNREGHWFSASV